MSVNKPIRRIAIVGTGVIGASWAAYYLRVNAPKRPCILRQRIAFDKGATNDSP
jgi:glycine/D-amino acid oxidase-like deaminating enzyme